MFAWTGRQESRMDLYYLPFFVLPGWLNITQKPYFVLVPNIVTKHERELEFLPYLLRIKCCRKEFHTVLYLPIPEWKSF